MQTTEIITFGSNRDSVEDVITKIRDICEKKGIEFKGPHPQPVVDLQNKQVDIDTEGVKLFDQVPSDREIEQLKGQEIHSREFEIHRYSSDEVVKEIIKQDYPPDVFLRVKVRETEFMEADRGNAPFSYDPSHDYNSEL